jgi:hypothetical protein
MTETPKSNTLVVTIRPSGSMQMKMFCGLSSVDHALCVCGGHPTHGWQEQHHRIVDAENSLTSDVACKRLSLEQLHHDAGHSLMFDDVKDIHDIGMVHPARSQGLPVKEVLRQARG